MSLFSTQTLTSAPPLLPFVLPMPSAPILLGLIAVHATVYTLAMVKPAKVGISCHFEFARLSLTMTH